VILGRPFHRLCGIAGLSTAALLCPYQALAELDVYAGSEVGYMLVTVNDETFSPWLINAHFDVRHDSGIGAEILLATGLASDEVVQVELDLSSHAAAYGTYSWKGRRVITTVGLGYGETTLDGSLRGDGSFPGESRYEGATGFVRFTEHLRRWPDWQASLGFYGLFDNSDIDIWSINAGIRYAF
jgi:hypothetical protein